LKIRLLRHNYLCVTCSRKLDGKILSFSSVIFRPFDQTFFLHQKLFPFFNKFFLLSSPYWGFVTCLTTLINVQITFVMVCIFTDIRDKKFFFPIGDRNWKSENHFKRTEITIYDLKIFLTKMKISLVLHLINW
jgi:hypothetical protein